MTEVKEDLKADTVELMEDEEKATGDNDVSNAKDSAETTTNDGEIAANANAGADAEDDDDIPVNGIDNIDKTYKQKGDKEYCQVFFKDKADACGSTNAAAEGASLNSIARDWEYQNKSLNLSKMVSFNFNTSRERGRKQNENAVTLNMLYKNKCLNTSHYDEWKRFIPNTRLAEALGIETRPFVISEQDLKSLISDTKLLLMLLLKLVQREDMEDEDADNLYHRKYTLSFMECCLKGYKENLNVFSYRDFDVSFIQNMIKEEPASIKMLMKENGIEDECKFTIIHPTEGETENKSEDQTTEDDTNKDVGNNKKVYLWHFAGNDLTESELAEIRNRKKKICTEAEKIQKEILAETSGGEDIKNEKNSNLYAFDFGFSPLIAPIIAAYAETASSNPLFIESVWKRKLHGWKYKMSTTDNAAPSDKLSKGVECFCRLMEFFNYEEKIETMSFKDAYKGYVKVVCATVCKIKDMQVFYLNSSEKEERKRAQFYEFEKIWGGWFLQKITDAIVCEQEKRECELTEDQMEDLAEELKDIFRDYDVFTRVDLAVKKIRLYYNEENRDTDEDPGNDLWNYYTKYEGYIAEAKERGNNIYHQMLKVAMNYETEKEIQIKKWGIKNVIFSMNFPEIEIEDGHEELKK